jgi:hypothetical protein
MMMEALKYQTETSQCIFIPEFKVLFNERGEVFPCESPAKFFLEKYTPTKIEMDRSDALLLFYVVSNRPNVDKVIKTYLPKG